jgi:hypothetical protein
MSPAPDGDDRPGDDAPVEPPLPGPEPLDGIAGADAHLGRPVPLPTATLPLTRWTDVRAQSDEGVEIVWNLDDSRAGAPGRIALYVGLDAPPPRSWPGDTDARVVPIAGTTGTWRDAELVEAQPSLRPAVELTWEAHGLHLRLTAQGPWRPERLVEIAASVQPVG